MQKKDYLKKISLAACVYYTAAVFAILFIYWLINADLSRGLHPVSLILILPFSFCFAAANTLFAHAFRSTATKVMVHYMLTIGGIWLFLFLPNMREGQSASGAFILFLVFTVVYVLIMAAVLSFRSRMKRITRDESEYVSVYGNKEK